MKILVTGGTGFIGYHLVKELVKQYSPADITCLVRSAEKGRVLESLGVRVVTGDLTRKETLREACQGVECVYHLAACVRFGIKDKSGVDFEADNVAGTKNLIESCPSTVRRFIHMSSVNAVERPLNDPCKELISEKSPCAPQTPYGKSKLMAEEIVRTLAPARKMTYLILRPPSIVYGAGCNPGSGMANLIKGVRQGSLLMALNFPGRFSIVHVKDLVTATIQFAGDEKLHDKVFFLANEKPYTLSEITDEISRQLGIGRKKITLPSFFYGFSNWMISLFSCSAFFAKKIPFQLLMLLRDQAAVSVEKARVQAGFRSTVSLEEGLKETIPCLLPNQK